MAGYALIGIDGAGGLWSGHRVARGGKVGTAPGLIKRTIRVFPAQPADRCLDGLAVLRRRIGVWIDQNAAWTPLYVHVVGVDVFVVKVPRPLAGRPAVGRRVNGSLAEDPLEQVADAALPVSSSTGISSVSPMSHRRIWRASRS